MTKVSLSLCAALLGLVGCVVEGDCNFFKAARQPAGQTAEVAGSTDSASADSAEESSLLLEVPGVQSD